jgi:hypothetical protein
VPERYYAGYSALGFIGALTIGDAGRYAGRQQANSETNMLSKTDFIKPFFCSVAMVPVGGDKCLMMVPIDDDYFFRMSCNTKLAATVSA